MKGEWLDWMILWVFSNLSDSMILKLLLYCVASLWSTLKNYRFCSQTMYLLEMSCFNVGRRQKSLLFKCSDQIIEVAVHEYKGVVLSE